MPRRTLLPALLLLTLGFVSASGQPSGQIPSPVELRQAGLELDWSTHVELDRSRSRVTAAHLHVVGLFDYDTFQKTAYEVHEIEYEGGVRRVAEYDLDATGRSLGRQEARRLAEKAVIQLQARGLKPKLTTRQVPVVTLYVQSTNGTLHAIDAESGKTLWAVSVGRPQSPTLRPSANDLYVAVVNGSRLFVLESKTGEVVGQHDLGGNPVFGPAVGKDMVFVPCANGRVEGFWLPWSSSEEDEDEDGLARAPWAYNSGARISGVPTITATTVSWPTEAGQMYVADLAGPTTRFRLDTAGPIQGSTVALPPSTLFVTSTDGYVFSVDETTGAFNWDFSSGEVIHQAPVAIGQSVFAVTENRNLYCLSAQDGSETWTAPNVRGMLGATQHRLYVSDNLGQIVALDLQSGGRLASLPTRGLDVRLVNAQTDRLYLGSRDGLLVCLRPIGTELPGLHLPLPQPPEKPADEAKPAETPAADQTDQADEDPFAGGAAVETTPAPPPPQDQDPFAEGDAEPPAEADAGAADDPFDAGG